MATQQGGVKILWQRTASIDLASTAANVILDSADQTVVGAMPGDPVFVGSSITAPAQGSYYGFVKAADTVVIRFVNNSAGAIDPAAQVFTIAVLKLTEQ